MKSTVKYCENQESQLYYLNQLNNPCVVCFNIYCELRRTMEIYKINDDLIKAGHKLILSNVDHDQLLKFHNRYLDIGSDSLVSVFISDCINGVYGVIDIARCGKCNCILKSNISQQCLWCGFNWHILKENAQQGDAPETASP